MDTHELNLKYGCNPHQTPARVFTESVPLPIRTLNGQPGYINLLDAVNSWQLVKELKAALNLPAAASFKHVSPAGAAVATPLNETLRQAFFVGTLDLSPLATAYVRARGADPMSSFGDWVALSDPADESVAAVIKREVSDGIIAPGYAPEALAILKKKKQGNYAILEIDEHYHPPETERKQLYGITFEQRRNDLSITKEILNNVVTKHKAMPDSAVNDLIIATIAVKYTQSNSVCLAYNGQVIGAGAGQQSRIHCTRLACAKADRWFMKQHPKVLTMKFAKGLKRPERINAIEQYLEETLTDAERAEWITRFEQVPEPITADEKEKWLSRFNQVALSSDAFFPFRDNIDRASRSGVHYVVQPGGSVADEEVIKAANAYAMVMIFSGVRLFHH
jgi:phosphoribosylaminoimidazolecarboxamide formyltransferase/IMP cyclohydrolase